MIFHLILRGFWIGIIGLSSVSAKINFENLHYSEFFTKKLKQKIKGLDGLIISLDKICSVIFSFTFLVTLSLLSLGLYFLFFTVILTFLNLIKFDPNTILGNIKFVFHIILISLINLTGLLYLVDFLTLGFLKKYKFISKIYYPVYYFYSFITLSFLYRSLYYTFINKFTKKRIALILIPYLLILFFLPVIPIDDHIFYADKSKNYEITSDIYDNLRPDDVRIRSASINSNIIKDKYIQLFIRYDVNDNQFIKNLCPDFTPKEGLMPKIDFSVKYDTIEYSTINSQNDTIKHIRYTMSWRPVIQSEKEPQKALQCLSSFYSVYINDSLLNGLEYYFYTHPNKKEKGIITLINTEGLKKGKNILEVKRKIRDDSYSYIPFWVE